MGKTIEIDIDDLDLTTDELLAMLKKRGYTFADEDSDFNITDLDTDDLIAEVESRGYEVVEVENLDAKMKVELFNENFQNVTMKQLETFFNDPDRSKVAQEVEELKNEISDLKEDISRLEDKIYDLEEE